MFHSHLVNWVFLKVYCNIICTSTSPNFQKTHNLAYISQSKTELNLILVLKLCHHWMSLEKKTCVAFLTSNLDMNWVLFICAHILWGIFWKWVDAAVVSRVQYWDISQNEDMVFFIFNQLYSQAGPIFAQVHVDPVIFIFVDATL